MPLTPNAVLKVKGFSVDDKILGEGAFASVFLCRKLRSREKFAAKVVEFDNSKRQRWETENEIEILKLLRQHHAIVNLLGSIRDRKFTVLLLEYIPGPRFIEGVLGWPRLSFESIKIIVKQLLEALIFCEGKRIVHRDINPDNLLWFDVPTHDNPYGKPLLKLIDFNLARRIPDGKSFISPAPMGNPSFMAPEVLSDHASVSCKSDVWSAGVFTFMLMGGYPPFWNDNYNYLLENIMDGNFCMPNHLWGHIEHGGKEFVKSMLEVNALVRPSASDLLRSPWLRRYRGDSKFCISQTRLATFFQFQTKVKKSPNFRNFKLRNEERKPFIPRFVSELDAIDSDASFDVLSYSDGSHDDPKETWILPVPPTEDGG